MEMEGGGRIIGDLWYYIVSEETE